MSKRAIGDVRPSQVITTFGPGAIVDLQTLSVVVAGTDGWRNHDEDVVHEPRLERALRVKRFFPAKATEGNFFSKAGTVPAHIFPRYQVCPVCRTLSHLDEGFLEYDPKWQEILCKAPGCKGRGKHRAATVPAPFIVACPSGHLDDFPWRQYAHRGLGTCKKRMTLYSVARTGAVSDIVIECSCGKGTRDVSDAFGEDRAQALGPCARRRPWLGIENRDPAACKHSDEVRAMQRGATNVWFPIVRSALAVKEAATPVGMAINACNAKQIEKIDSIDKLRILIEMGMFPTLESFPADEVWETLRRMRGEIETDEVDLRWPEWVALRDPESACSDKGELFLQNGQIPKEFEGQIARIVLARKLLEVRALVAFTRIDAVGGGADDNVRPDLAPISKARQDWLPAVEVRGEGIFIELREEALAAWEARADVKARASAMADKFKEWEKQRGSDATEFPGSRYVLLHSLAHTLIRQLSLDCGYSASSVRERIYSSLDPKRKMAGVLLYTASADSEGSLGGLVDLGAPKRFPGLFTNALRTAARCSSDPLCADHQPDVHATINGAACHACILASETSCESFNRFLDRSYLVPTMAQGSMAYFPLSQSI